MHTLTGMPAAPAPSLRTFETRYRGYLVAHRPQPTPDGRFLAYVVIRRDLQHAPIEASEMPELPVFELQGDAALAGLAAGLRWIDRQH